jgi:hypothetical protein
MWRMIWREQRRGWLITAVCAAAVLGGLVVAFARWAEVGAAAEPVLTTVGIGFAALAASAHGMFAGTRMPADGPPESLAGTLRRGSLRRFFYWVAQTLTGAAVVLAQAVLLTVLVLLVGLCDGAMPPWWWPGLVPVFALAGYAWGLGGAALARTVESRLPIAWSLLSVAWLFSLAAGTESGLVFLMVSAVALPLLLEFSGLAFCLPRRLRSKSPQSEAPRTTSASWAMLQLAARQGWIEAGLLTAAVLLLPLANSGLWPLGVFLVSLVFGVIPFAGEYKDGKYRFLDEHWLPANWVWLGKTACWLLGAAGASAAVLLAALRWPTARAQVRSRDMGLLHLLHSPRTFSSALCCLSWGRGRSSCCSWPAASVPARLAGSSRETASSRWPSQLRSASRC